MQKATQSIKICLLIVVHSLAFSVWGQAAFIPNQGQWDGDFLYKTELTTGAIFFEERGYTTLLSDPEAIESRHHHGEEEHHEHAPKEEYLSVAYKMKWLNALPSLSKQVSGFSEREYYHNYFLGNDSTRWKGNVPVYRGISYNGLYEGVTINYFEDGDNLKYDILLAANADPSVLQMEFEGLDGLEISEGRLVLNTAIGPIYEYIPEAYQIIDGQKVIVACNYTLENNQVGFKLGDYDLSQALIIDPVLDFATVSGATNDNWGFTATYDNSGNFYGGGIVEGAGYPTTLGSLQLTYGGGKFDVAISKFSSTGQNLLYSTFIGGSSIEMPHSMIVDDSDNLIILGSTGSTDFPMTTIAYQDSLIKGSAVNWDPWTTKYHNGANAFVMKLNSTGSAILAGTFLGSTQGAVGTNTEIVKNYCDETRGEVIILNNGNIAITTSSESDNLPFLKPGTGLGTNSQNAIVVVFNPSLTHLIWGSYYGGADDETGNSIKTNGTDVFICGATKSANLPTHPTSFQSSYSGAMDGYIAKFDGNNGHFLGSTYIGTSSYDQAFFIDVDKFGSVFVLGQTKGSIPVTSGKYANSGSRQFIQKYSSDLSNRIWSTVVGSGQAKSDLVPSAFMVDNCLRIYVSGWNGSSNNLQDGNGQLGNTHGLTTTKDAIDSTTDGSDFYFMVLDRDATRFLYGTYYGGRASEHVDGGTSRFSPDGTIYQAVCAACGFLKTFPTTPGVYGPAKPLNTNCNLGAIKISLEQTVKATPDIEITFDVDTVCDQLIVRFDNRSQHANKYYWDFGNGLTSNDFEPTTIYKGLGVYTVMLVAEDTVCDISDTATITINNDTPRKPKASMDYDYFGCDKKFQVNFNNTSPEVNQFFWDFGDGTKSNDENPTHFFPGMGNYQIMLIATDTMCQLSDTVYANVTFEDSTVVPRTEISYKECSTGEIDVVHVNYRARYLYEWQYSGKKATGAYPNIKFDKPGIYAVNLSVEDPLCTELYEQNFKVEIEAIQSEIFIPNAFSPNGDGINEEFVLSGDRCNPNDYFRIFNRWGQIVFETENPFTEFWDGTNDGQEPKEDVYTYILNTGKEIKRGYLTLFR